MMGRPRRQLTKEEYQYLVAMRLDSLYQAFSTKMMLKKLSELGKGFWKSERFLAFLVEQNILHSARKGTYSFDKPFSFEQLRTAVHRYQCECAKNNIRSRRRKEKVQKVEPNPAPVVIDLDIAISNAIALLKQNDYRVQAKFFDIEEALKNPSSKVEDFVKWVDC